MTRKKIIITSSIILFGAIAALVLYFFTIYRVESALQRLVHNQSNGKLIFKVKKVDLNIFDLRFAFHEPEIRTIDSNNSVSGYHVKADEFSLNIHSLLSVISSKPLIIDSVIVQSPLIEVFKYKEKEGPRHKISLPQEMSKVYESLEKVLKVLNLNYLHVSDAKFRIYDRTGTDTKPLTVSNLNLTIDNVSKEPGASENKFLFADRILLEIYNEDITLPDGYHGIKFKRLWMGTRSQMIKLDSCYIYGRSSDSTEGEFSVFIDSLRIKKLDFNALAKENKIRFDSALCINPAIYFNLQIKDKGKKPKFDFNRKVDSDSIDQKLKKMLGNLDIGYLTVKNASVHIVTNKNDKTNIYNTKNSNFSLGGLVVSSDQNVPIALAFLDLNVSDYTGYSPDSMYVIKFDDVIVHENRIRLSNFRISPSASNPDRLRKEIKMKAFELDDIDWLTLLYENRIVAGHASLIKPEVQMILPASEKNKEEKKKVNPFLILDQIQNKVQIGKLFIEDGTVTIEVLKGPKISMKNCYLGINVDTLLAARDEFRLINSFDTLSFAKGDFYNSGSHFSLAGGSYSKVRSSLSFRRITEGKTNKSQSISINNVHLKDIEIHSRSDISMAELSWGSAEVDIRMNPDDKKKPAQSKSAADFKFSIRALKGGPTKLAVKNRNIEASTVLNHITTGEIVIESGQKPKIKGLIIDGQAINLDQKNKLQGNLSDFYIQDNKPSTFNNVMVKLPFNGEMASIMIPKLTFKADIFNSLNGEITADFIEMSNPSISFSQYEGALPDTINKQKKNSELPILHINRISIDKPVLLNLPARLSDKMQIDPGILTIDLLGINSDTEVIKVDSIRLSVSQPGFATDRFRMPSAGMGKIDFSGSAFALYPANQQSKSKWSFNLSNLKLSGIKINTMQNDSIRQTIVLNSLNLDNFQINDSLFNKPEKFININSHFRISKGNIRLENSKSNLAIFNFSLTKSNNSLEMDSMAFSPALERDAFMKTQDYQATHIQVHTGKINAKDIDFNIFIKDTVISLKKVTVSDVHLLAYKDKRLPFHHGIYKPMLTDLLLNIKPKINVDSLILKNGLIEYEEFNNKTQQIGQIKLSKVKGAVAGIRTFNPLPDDSLKFNVYARLTDTAEIRLRYKQSYTDSLSGFNLKLIVSSLNLTALNPILRPFASAELKSGYLDTIRMSVIGRKYVAYGIMKMYYYDLNAQLLSKGDSSAKTIVTKSASFFANRIVHTRNRRGTGDVFAERDPEKGFVNYWVKIVIGGVLTNSGVRTDKKQQRKYKKALNNHDVPPIPDIPVDY